MIVAGVVSWKSEPAESDTCTTAPGRGLSVPASREDTVTVPVSTGGGVSLLVDVDEPVGAVELGSAVELEVGGLDDVVVVAVDDSSAAEGPGAATATSPTIAASAQAEPNARRRMVIMMNLCSPRQSVPDVVIPRAARHVGDANAMMLSRYPSGGPTNGPPHVTNASVSGPV